MTDYYKLFDYCQKTTIDNDLKKDRIKRNKESRQKKYLFKTITENAYHLIKKSVDDGNDYAIIYENDYNKLINDLMDSLILHFKPFNVIYKKKSNIERGLLEVLKDESNYVIIVDWNAIKNTELTELINVDKKINNKKDINIPNNFEEENTCDNLIEVRKNNSNNDNTNNDNNKISDSEVISRIIGTKEKIKKKDNLLEKLGFETIF